MFPIGVSDCDAALARAGIRLKLHTDKVNLRAPLLISEVTAGGGSRVN